MIKPVTDFIAEAKSRCKCIDVESARKLYDEADNALILDVREPQEAGEKKLNNSINIPRGMLEMKVPQTCQDPDMLILTHCAGGGRASMAADRLQEMGYTNVHVIDAKFDDIKEAFD